MNETEQKLEQLNQENQALKKQIQELQRLNRKSNQVEKALNLEREKAQRYLEIAPFIVLVLHPDENVSLINQKGCDVLGYSQDEMIGQNWMENFLPPRLREKTRKIFRQIISGKIENIEYVESVVLTKNGQERQVAWRNAVLTDSSGNIIGTLSSGEDIAEKTKAQEQLKIAETKYRTLVEQVPVVIYLDPIEDSDTSMYVSPQIADLVGCAPDEWRDNPEFWREVIHPDDYDEIMVDYSDPFIKEYRLITRDGRTLWVRDEASIVYDEQGNALFRQGIMMDITEQKRIEQALRENEARYRKLTDNMTDLIIETDQSGVIQYASPSFETLLKIHPDDMINQSALEIDVIHPDDLQSMASTGANIIRAGQRGENPETWRQECRMKSKDGNYLWIELSIRFMQDEKGKLTGTVAIGRDITARKRVALAFKESEERFRMLVENLGEGTAIVDKNETFTFANPAAEHIFGVSRGELVGRNIREFTDAKQYKAIKKQTQKRRQGEINSYEIEITCPDGEHRIVIITATPQMLDNNYQGAFGIFRDITDSKNAEKSLRNSEERYRNIFETAGVSIWEEDFSEVKKSLDALSRQGVRDFPKYFDEHPEFIQHAASLIRVIDVNEATIRLFDANSKAEILGAVERIFVPETLIILREELIAMAEGRTYFEGETINQTLSGERLNVLLTMTLPSDPEGYHSVLVSLMDITDRKRAEQEIAVQRARFQQLFENAPLGIAVVDQYDNIQDINKAFESIFQYRTEEVFGLPLNDTIVPEIRDNEASSLSVATLAGASVQKETVRKRKDGSLVPVQIYGVPINLDGETVGAYGMYVDISDRKHKEEKLEYISTHDTLTGLFNRAYFETVMARLENDQAFPVSIMVADVDGLKNINDRLGHAAGDRLLRDAARLLKKAFRASDVTARIGGDEFAALLPGADEAAASHALERVTHILKGYNSDHDEFPIHISIGMATSTRRISLTKLMQQADQRMYREKAAKKARKA